MNDFQEFDGTLNKKSRNTNLSKLFTHFYDLNSEFRNRKNWPLPGRFEIPYSNIGVQGQINFVDPISNGIPVRAWSSNYFNSLGGVTYNGQILISGLGFSSNNITFIVSGTVAFSTQNLLNYYQGAIITINGHFRRIIKSLYILSNKLQITVDSPFVDGDIINGRTISISDPTDLTTLFYGYFFVPAGSTFDGAYKGFYLYNETLNDFRSITSYDGTTHICSVDAIANVMTGWLVTHNYSIREKIPELVSGITNASTTTVIYCTSWNSLLRENSFLRIRAQIYGNGQIPPEGETSEIVSISPATQSINIFPPLSTVPNPLSIIEACTETYDNLAPIIFTGSLELSQQPIYYDLTLVSLILPNRVLNVSTGGKITDYTHVYVEVNSITSPTSNNKNLIYSNNPNNYTAIFKVSIPELYNPETSDFIKLEGDNNPQTFLFKPDDSLLFSVKMPSGEIFDTILSENFSPLKPNPLCQISATVSIKKNDLFLKNLQ